MTVLAPSLPTAGWDNDRCGLESLVSILQLTDSAFPSGRYTLSYGLETLTQSGHLTVPADAAGLLVLLQDSIRFGVAPSDGLAVACAHRVAAADADIKLLVDVDQRLTAVKLAREAREASTRTGRAVLATATAAICASTLSDFAELVGSGRSPGNHAVVIGILGALLGTPRIESVIGELYAYASGWASAAVRLSLADHRTAQGLLHGVRAAIADAGVKVVDGDINQIASCTPLLDVMLMRHEHAEVRLFAS